MSVTGVARGADRLGYAQAVLAVVALSFWAAAIGPLAADAQSRSRPPNIVYIMIDDLNDYSTAFDGFIGVAGSGHPQAVTPNIEAFLKSLSTTHFLSAYTPVPACKGARTAIMSAVSPGRSGVVSNYSQSIGLNPEFEDIELMHHYFRNRGYLTFSAGKVEHGTEQRSPALFDILRKQGNNIPDSFNGSFTAWDQVVTVIGLQNELQTKAAALGVDITLDPALSTLAEFRWGELDLDEKIWPDYKTTSAAIEFIERQAADPLGKPFFLAHGIEKPHLPWFCPSKYFDKVAPAPSNVLVAPAFPGDLDDTGPIASRWATDPSDPYDFTAHITRLGFRAQQEAVHSYLACTVFADAQVGRLLKALDESGLADNTIVVLTSDHGWMLGEKNSWGKLRLWEESLRVPFGIRVPQQYIDFVPPRPQYIHPVSTGSIYATLADLAFGDKIESDYSSLVPLINSLTTDTWVAEDIASYFGDVRNVSLRRPAYRYTVYSDGFEELYDHRNDQGEHTNVADVPGYEAKRAESCLLVKQEMPDANC